MAQMGHRLDAGPEDGERFMTTGDARELLAQLAAHGDDGTVLLHAKVAMSGKVTKLWAVIVPRRVTRAEADWGILLAPERGGLGPAGELDPGDPTQALPAFVPAIEGQATSPPRRRHARR